MGPEPTTLCVLGRVLSSSAGGALNVVTASYINGSMKALSSSISIFDAFSFDPFYFLRLCSVSKGVVSVLSLFKDCVCVFLMMQIGLCPCTDSLYVCMHTCVCVYLTM